LQIQVFKEIDINEMERSELISESSILRYYLKIKKVI